jgi:phosphoserine phosphatase
VKALVVFDCDSTLVKVEGVDELAIRAGVGEGVAEMTRSAMEGIVALEEVYGQRLEIIRPGRKDLAWLGRRYCATLVDGARETVSALTAEGAEIHVISGGLLPAVVDLAGELGIPSDRVHAVGVSFDGEGQYAGFEADSPLARAGGKAEVIERLSRPGWTMVMIGDGMTDLEAADAGAVTIGFGGVVARPGVAEKADQFVAGPSLEPVVELILSLSRG